MLHLQAVFQRKMNEFHAKDCEIEKIVELTEDEYQNFQNHLIQDADFISENKKLMHTDESHIYHCLLVLRQNSTEGVLIQSEGYDYARYASLLPGARDYVTARLNELADQIIREGTQNTKNGTWAVSFEEFKEHYNINLDSSNSIGAMLTDILETRPELASVEPMEDSYEMDFFLDYCLNINEEEKHSLGIPDDVYRLKDMIRVPIENLHLVHHKVDMVPATIVYLSTDTLTEEGKQEWGDVLNAQVLRVFHGIYGIQAECTGVDPKRLANFSLMLAGYCSSEDYDRWIRDAPDSPGMTMKL